MRIGKTLFTYTDAATGQEVSEPIMRCVDCPTEGFPGFEMSRTMHDQLHELAVTTARANRLLLRARRGGVQVRQHESLLDAAVDAHIEMQVLVHGFHAGEESEFENLARRASKAPTPRWRQAPGGSKNYGFAGPACLSFSGSCCWCLSRSV
jgi:hypothetical protein